MWSEQTMGCVRLHFRTIIHAKTKSSVKAKKKITRSSLFLFNFRYEHVILSQESRKIARTQEIY